MSNTVKLQAIEAFMARAQQAVRLGSKEIRLSAQETNELTAAIGQILTQNVILSQKVRETENLVGSSIRLDGGKFG